MDDFPVVNEVYAKYFEGVAPPARACFACKTLPKNALVEIDAVALRN
jgi:2-iminobutanoate/2-iminopropanoate deaminase